LIVRAYWLSTVIWVLVGVLFVGVLIPTPIYIRVYKEAAEYAQQHYDSYYNIKWTVLGVVCDAIFSTAFWTATATIAIACFTWRLKLSTDRLWNAARDQLITTQRAWVRIDKIGFDGGLAINMNGAVVFISCKITNVGNSPAINVRHHIWLFVLKSSGPTPWQEQQRRCDEIRNQPFDQTFVPGFTLFPGETFPRNIGDNWSLQTNASREDIEKGAAMSVDKKHIVLFVIGCIDYTFPTDATTHHQTGFIFEVLKDFAFVSLEDGEIPGASSNLMEHGIGAGRHAD
jgi:hypothetical protein